MQYAYEDLSPRQFEELVTLVCQELLGLAVQTFAPGTDGGIDAKFVGRAQMFPSAASGWEGTTIIQAKHTNGYNRSFSETDFYNPGSKNAILSLEIPSIKKLRELKQLDHYMLFSNRRLAARADTEIRGYLSRQCGIPMESIYLCDVEGLEMYLKRYPKIPSMANLDPVDGPLTVSPQDLADVVSSLARQIRPVGLVDHPPTERLSYEDKNRINNMTTDYAKEQRKKYLKDTAPIRAFLAAPENADLLRQYESVVDEFQLKIIARRKDFQSFDRVMEYLIDQLFSRDAVLRQRQHKKLTRVMLFYMYWNCDIGEVQDVTA